MLCYIILDILEYISQARTFSASCIRSTETLTSEYTARYLTMIGFRVQGLGIEGTVGALEIRIWFWGFLIIAIVYYTPTPYSNY